MVGVIWNMSPAVALLLGATVGYIVGKSTSTVFWLLFYRKGR